METTCYLLPCLSYILWGDWVQHNKLCRNIHTNTNFSLRASMGVCVCYCLVLGLLDSKSFCRFCFSVTPLTLRATSLLLSAATAGVTRPSSLPWRRTHTYTLKHTLVKATLGIVCMVRPDDLNYSAVQTDKWMDLVTADGYATNCTVLCIQSS